MNGLFCNNGGCNSCTWVLILVIIFLLGQNGCGSTDSGCGCGCSGNTINGNSYNSCGCQ